MTRYAIASETYMVNAWQKKKYMMFQLHVPTVVACFVNRANSSLCASSNLFYFCYFVILTTHIRCAVLYVPGPDNNWHLHQKLIIFVCILFFFLGIKKLSCGEIQITYQHNYLPLLENEAILIGHSTHFFSIPTNTHCHSIVTSNFMLLALFVRFSVCV